MAEAF